MKAFKPFIQVIILATFTFNFTSCGSDSGPENVVADFYNNISQLDFDGAKELCTDDTKQLVGTLEGMLAMMSEDKKDEALANVSNKSVSSSDFTCNIDVSSAVCVENKTENETNLVLVDGKWLIDMPKEDFDKE